MTHGSSGLVNTVSVHFSVITNRHDCGILAIKSKEVVLWKTHCWLLCCSSTVSSAQSYCRNTNMGFLRHLYVFHLAVLFLAGFQFQRSSVLGRLLSVLKKPDPDNAVATARWLVSQNSWGVLKYTSFRSLSVRLLLVLWILTPFSGFNSDRLK